MYLKKSFKKIYYHAWNTVGTQTYYVLNSFNFSLKYLNDYYL